MSSKKDSIARVLVAETTASSGIIVKSTVADDLSNTDKDRCDKLRFLQKKHE